MSRRRALGRAVGQRGEEHDALYHVTLARNLPSIARHGLQPSRGLGHGVGKGGYRDWSRGKVFLTDDKGVFFWHGRVEDHATDETDDLADQAVVPVVLRIRRLRRLLQDDTVARSEWVDGSAYYVGRPIVARKIEVFDGEAWVPVERYLDPEEVERYVGQHVVREHDEDGSYDRYRRVIRRGPTGSVEMDSTLPPELFP